MRMSWPKYNIVMKRRRDIVDSLFKNANIYWWLLGIAFILAVTWLIFPMEERQRFVNPGDFELGRKSARDVFATADIEYYATIDNEEEKQKVLSEVPPVFNLDFQVIKKAEEQFNIVRQVRINNTLSAAEKVDKMKYLFYIGPSDEIGLILTKASDEQIEVMREEVINVLSDILAKGVIADSGFAGELSKIEYIKPKLDQIREELERQTGMEPTPTQIAARVHVALVDTRLDSAVEKIVLVENLLSLSNARMVVQNRAEVMLEPIGSVVEEMCVDLLRPNLVYNPVLTQKRLEKLVSGDSSAKRISKGDRIISVGDMITESHIEKLKAIYSAQRRDIIYAIPSVLLLILVLVCLLTIYLRRHEPSAFSGVRKFFALTATILLVLILGNLVITRGPKLGLEYPGFLVPTALASIVVAIIANVQLSILVTCIIGIFIAILSGVSQTSALEYFLVAFTGGTAAAISMSKARHRRHLIVPGFYVSVVNVATILALGLLKDVPLTKLGTNCLLGALNGTVVALLTPGLLPIFEYLSRTTTDMELMELSDLNQPLLAQLKEKASGSYYHSIDVAKLAESSAEAIGANPLLTRVGSYYHDIGKMTKPEYFIENQKGENVHDRLNPSMSSRVISAHVKDGVKIAKDYKLPQVIQDIIQQHHGNTMIGGLRFYQKAVEADKHNTVKIEDFRYPGPRPQTKEAAIILLADSVESARHVLLRDNPSYSRLIGFVREIIEDKIMDSQLDECDLSLRDVSLTIDAFVRVLSGTYHTRIEYPKGLETLSLDTESGELRGTENGGTIK